MKFPSFVIFAFAVYLTVASVSADLKYVRECADKLGMKLPRSRNLHSSTFKMFPKTPKCFYKCIAEKNGFVDASGEPNYDEIKETFNLSDVQVETSKKCIDGVDQKDSCRKVAAITRCFIR